MAGKKRSGKGSRVAVGATVLTHSEWDATWRGDDLDTTCFEDDGKETGIIGVEVVEFNCGGDWDAARNPFDPPPGFYPRDDMGGLKFYENVADNVFWSLTASRILSARNGAQARGKVTFQGSGKSNGAFVPPTGSV